MLKKYVCVRIYIYTYIRVCVCVCVCVLGMRGIPVLEKYRYILCFKRYDIIILLNPVFHTLLLRSAPVGGSASQITAQSVNVTTEQHAMDHQTDEALSMHPKLINKENSRSEMWHYCAYKTDDKGERADLTAPVCKRCYTSCVATGGNASNFLSICRLLILIFSEN